MLKYMYLNLLFTLIVCKCKGFSEIQSRGVFLFILVKDQRPYHSYLHSIDHIKGNEHIEYMVQCHSYVYIPKVYYAVYVSVSHMHKLFEQSRSGARIIVQSSRLHLTMYICMYVCMYAVTLQECNHGFYACAHRHYNSWIGRSHSAAAGQKRA